jgi:hypothetical protein
MYSFSTPPDVRRDDTPMNRAPAPDPRDRETVPAANPKQKVPGPDEPSNLEKDPADWVTGDEPMTDAQASYLKTLCEEAHEPFEDGLSKADASRRIDALQARTGRGQPRSRAPD